MALVPFITEGFNGTAGQTLQAYSASWVAHPNSVGTIGIVTPSYTAARASSAVNSLYRHTTATPSADYSVTGTFIRPYAGTAYGGICARLSSSAATFYMARYATLEGQLQLYKFVSGAVTLLGSRGSTLPINTPRTLRLEVIGSAIKVYENGSSTASISVTDSAISAAGFAGIRLNESSLDLDSLVAEYESGGGATTSVSTDLAAEYKIRSTVYADGAGAYAVRSVVAADTSPEYSIRGAISSDASASYIVRALAQADIHSAYLVRVAAQADAASTFTVRGGAASDATAAYLLRGSASSDLSAAYEIQTASGVGASLDASYNVRAAVQSDASAAYDLRTAVGATSEHAFMVRGLVSSDLDASYTVEASITQVYADLQAAYLVDGGAVFIPSQFVASVPAGVFSARAPAGEYSATVPAGIFKASI